MISQENKDFHNPAQRADIICASFRSKLAERGARGIIGIQRQFKIADDDNSKTLSYYEFAKACSDFKINLATNDIKLLFE